MRFLIVTITLLSLLFRITTIAQNAKIDSLQNLIKSDKEDTSKINHLNALGWELMYSNPDTAILLGNLALKLSEKINFKESIANSLNNLGFYSYLKSDYAEALKNYLNALKYFEDLSDKRGIASCLGNIGSVYKDQAEYTKALDYYLRALKIKEEINDKKGMATQLGNIGLVHYAQTNYSKALDYYLNALKYFEELNDKIGIAVSLGNIGNIYKDQFNYLKALDYYFMALIKREELGAKNLMATTLGNIGIVYANMSKEPKISFVKRDSLLNESLDYFFRALKIKEEIGDKKGIAIALGNIGSLYTLMKKSNKAEKYLFDALGLNKEIGGQDYERQVEVLLSELYENTNRYQLALEHYKKSTVLKDTIFNQEKNKEITRKEMNYEFEKKEAITKAENDKQIAISEAEKKKQKIIIYSVVGGLLLVALFAGLIFRSLRITQKQKVEIEKQKSLVDEKNKIVQEQKKHIEEKHKETTDSITYARRLQQAILPPTELIKKYLPESFLLYKPKDIVAGDFYWMEFFDNTVFIAAADCTGHGVPGAMVSVVCSNALNQTVKEFGLRDTGKILDKVTDLVLETFEKSSSEVKDGMDISLLSYNKISKQIQWSGANNSLCYFVGKDLIEIKADKQPIGKYDTRKPFTTHTIEYSPNSVFYLFTDGLPDQFGGPKGKKYLYKRFENNLSDICKLPMDEQQTILEKVFQDWKGTLEQVDDVTVIGIKI